MRQKSSHESGNFPAFSPPLTKSGVFVSDNLSPSIRPEPHRSWRDHAWTCARIDMSDAAKAARIDQLLHLAAQRVSSGDAAGGRAALGEAVHLDSENPDVKAAFAYYADGATSKAFSELCRDYISSRGEVVGRSALAIAPQTWLDGEDLERGLRMLLLREDVELPLKDQIVAKLLGQTRGKTYLVGLLSTSVTETFIHLWIIGSNTLDALVSILLDPTPWSPPSSREQAEKDVFILLLAKIMEPGVDEPQIAMKAIARLLAADPSFLAPTIDADSFDTILSSLGTDRIAALRSQATLAVAKYLEAKPAEGQQFLTKFVVSRVRNGKGVEMIVAFSVACAIFPIIPSFAASLFLTAGFVERLARLTDATKSTRLRHTSLELLSAACVDKACREAISQTCIPMLEHLMTDPKSDEDLSLAALVLSKIRSSSYVDADKDAQDTTVEPSVTDLVALFRRVLLDKGTHASQNSVEGLAYMSIRPEIKEQLASDAAFLKDLIRLLSQPDTSPSALFGGFTIFANLSTYLPTLAPEQTRLAELKAYANSQKPSASSPLNDSKYVDVRCQNLIDAGLVPLVVKVGKTATPSIQCLIAAISVNLTRLEKSRGKLVQQGLLDVVLRQCTSPTPSPPSSENAAASPSVHPTSAASAHALACLLLPLNPALIFNTPANRSIPNTVRALTTILTPTNLPDSDMVDYAPVFHSLRALTNLASLDEPTRKTIVSLSWQKIEDLLWAANLRIQQAAVELVNNLILSPFAAVKFISDQDPGAHQRLRLLFALTGSEVLGIKRAAAGALAMMAPYMGAASAYLKVDGFVKGAVELAQDESAEVVKRAILVLTGLVVKMADEMESDLEQARGLVKAARGAEVMRELRKRKEFEDDFPEIDDCLEALGG